MRNRCVLGSGSENFSIIFFSAKKYDFMHFERHFAFKNAKHYIFQKNRKKFKVSSVNLGRVRLL